MHYESKRGCNISGFEKKTQKTPCKENDGQNITLKTLFEVIEQGLGGKLEVSVEL